MSVTSRQNPPCVVIFEPVRVTLRLGELGLTDGLLRESLNKGLAAHRKCHEYHPTSYPGIVMWGESVRWLRDGLVRTGDWRCDDTFNLPTVMKIDGSMAIAVVRGDSNTGNPDLTPSTQYARGVSTQVRVEVNRVLPFDHLPPQMFEDTPERSRISTYLLLHHVKGDQLRCELSRPVEINKKGYVEEFSERVILGSITLDGTPMRVSDETPINPVVTVRRRA